MKKDKRIRYLVIAAFLLLGVFWSTAAAVNESARLGLSQRPVSGDRRMAEIPFGR